MYFEILNSVDICKKDSDTKIFVEVMVIPEVDYNFVVNEIHCILIHFLNFTNKSEFI